MRFQEIPSLDKVLLFPSSPELAIIIIASFSLAIFFTLFFGLNLIIKKPGSQVMKLLEMDINANKELFSQELVDKRLEKEKKMEKQATAFNINAQRCGVLVSYDDLIPVAKERLTVTLGLSFGIFILYIVLFGVLLGKPILDTIFLGMIITFLFGIHRSFKEYFKVKIKSKRLKNEYIEAIYYFISMYKYSSREKSISNIITEYIDRAGALKVDFMMLVSDINAMSVVHSFDKFAERIDLQEIREFSSFMKSTESLNETQLMSSIAVIDRDMKEKLLSINKKRVNRKFTIIFAVMMLCFLALIILMNIDSLASLLINTNK